MRPYRLMQALILPAVASLLAACSSGTELDNCDPATTLTLTIGVQVSDAIDTKHCISGEDPGDLFTMTLTQQSVVRFTAASSAFQPELSIAKPSATPSADDEVVFAAGKPAVAVLPAGQYVVDIQSSSNAVGAYTLNPEIVGLNACYANAGTLVFMAAGQTLSSEIASQDCAPAEAPTARFEVYSVYLRAGKAYTFTAATGITAFNLALGNGTTTLAGAGVITTNGTATITYTPTSSGYYVINFAPIGNRVGAYTLTVSP